MQFIFSTGLVVLMLSALCQKVYAENAPLALSGAWVRAMPPGRAMTAAYLRVDNQGSSAVQVTGVSASRGEASLHETLLSNGRSTMRGVSELSIDAGGELVLEPGGLHIMLMGLATTPKEGDLLKLCLQSTVDEVCVDAPVRRGPPSSADSMSNHAHHQ